MRMHRRELVVSSVLLCACGAALPPPSAPSPLLGGPLPNIARPTLDGTPLEAVDGRAVVVKFFAKYCEPCQRTLPAAQRLHLERQDVLFVGVAEDEHASDVVETVQRFGLTFPVIHDRSNVLAGRFRVRELPVTFVADRSGVVRWVGGPGQSETDLEQALSSVQ